MLITRTSKLSDITRTREIDCNKEEYTAWVSGVLIQDAMPHLSVDDREFLINGTTKKEWDSTFIEEVTE
jgi:hypothetical protein